ncbi:MAG: c-type cytochrome biogenesis protein CcmI, partial [Rhodospirillales bacterium]|nr:c-type cytochrome biogenesis protein CcmI [Rhodospirillales bacterium]
MIFWMIVALLAGGLGVALARPLLRGSGEAGSVRAAYDMQVYRDQLDEIERDRARGVLTDDQAAAARLEVERRLLAAGEDAKRDLAKGGGGAPLLAAGVAAVVPVAAIAVYATLGWPGVPGYPLAQRLDRAPAGTQMAQAAQGGQPNAADPHPTGGGSTESMAQLTERLAKRLEANPGDPEGWSLLARSYQQLNRHREAVGALERAVALTNRDPQMVATLGEARIMA